MKPSVELRLPFPPSVNHLWRTMVLKGHAVTYLSKEGKKYRNEVRFAVLTQCGHNYIPIEGRLGVVIVAHAKDNRLRDLDNLLKGSLDSIMHAGVYEDDSQIDSLTITRGTTDPEKRGYLMVWITKREDDCELLKKKLAGEYRHLVSR